MDSTVPNYVNIACGNAYLPGWTNLDYSPVSTDVIRADLTGRLPLADNSADLVYSSHFFEHIPTDRTAGFLAECHRILKPGGVLRLVMPDFDDVCREYLLRREAGEHDKADFLIVELLDQCVRKQPGGRLASVLAEAPNRRDGGQLHQYILHRLGNYVDTPPTQAVTLKRIWRALRSRLESLYINILLRLLPAVFRQQNVSRAVVGETHAWVYDFHTISRLLGQSGFVEVTRAGCDSSRLDGFPCFPLDLDDEGKPRKGVGSLVVEAVKAIAAAARG